VTGLLRSASRQAGGTDPAERLAEPVGDSPPAGDDEAFRSEVGGLARGGLLNLGSSMASQLAMLALTIVLARVLGRDTAGVYFQSFAFLSLLSLLSLAGFRGALTRFVAMHLANDDVPRMVGAVRLALCISVPASVALAGGLYAAAPWLARSAFDEPRLEVALRVAAVALPAVSLQEAALSATQGFRTMKAFALVGLLLEPVLRLVLSGALLAAGFGLRGTLVALTISSWIGAAAAVTWLHRLVGRAREGCTAAGPAVVVDAGPFLRYSVVAWVASLASTGLIWADTIILGLMVTSGAVGVYNASARLVTLAVFVVNPINAAFAPRIANLFARGELGLLREIYTVATNWIVRLSLPAFAILLVLPGSLLGLFFGGAYAAGATVVAILALGQLCNAATGPCGMVINMSGRNRLNLIDNLMVLGLNIVLNVVLIPIWGISGAALAWAISLGAVNLLRVLQVRIIVRALPFDLAQAKAFLAAIGAGAAALVTSRWLLDGPTGALAGIAAAGAVYVALVIALGLPDSDRMIAGLLTQRGPGRRAGPASMATAPAPVLTTTGEPQP